MSDVAVLINTWDGYADAWPMMSHSLQKYWPDCPWPIYWMCNELEPPMGTPIRISEREIGQKLSWGEMMQLALQEMPCGHFLFLHEDYWLVEPVNTDRLLYHLEAVKLVGLDHLQLVDSANVMKIGAWPLYVGLRDDDVDLWIHPVMKNSDYRTSNQASLWRTQAYFEILGELLICTGDVSPWDFEVTGSQQSLGHSCATILGPARWPLKYVYRHLPDYDAEPIVKGRWTQAAVQYCETEGLPYSFEAGERVAK